MHIADLERGNLGANAIVGGGVPIAVGAALASKLQHSDLAAEGKMPVAISFFGDGASNQGVVHEAMNLASVWKLPVIFVCENNGYGISVPQWQSTSVKDIAVRGLAYDMPYETADGNKAPEVLAAAARAVGRARTGGGPTLLEFKTYRWLGHWTGDPCVYRTREEVEEWKKRCPIQYVRGYMLEKNLASEAELDAIEKKARADAEAAAEYALSSPEPDPARVMDDVFNDTNLSAEGAGF